MTDMRKRVAKAKLQEPDPFERWFLRYAASQYPFYKPESAAEVLRSSLGTKLLAAYRAGYSAALAALAEPTPDMVEAAHVELANDSGSIETVWRAMISAARNSTEKTER